VVKLPASAGNPRNDPPDRAPTLEVEQPLPLKAGDAPLTLRSTAAGGNPFYIIRVSFSEDGQRAMAALQMQRASSIENLQVFQWDLQTGKEFLCCKLPDTLQSFFSLSGSLLVVRELAYVQNGEVMPPHARWPSHYLWDIKANRHLGFMSERGHYPVD